MKSLKLTYTLMLLIVTLGLNAQEKHKVDEPKTPVQVVALGAKMPYSVDVIDPVSGASYSYYWELLEGSNIRLRGINSSAVSLIYADTKVQVGKTYRLIAYVKREDMCDSDPSEINVKIIEKPIVSFVSGDVEGLCSFSELNSEQRAEFDVKIEGYYGEWDLNYSILDDSGNVIENKSVHITGKTGEIIIVLNDKFMNKANSKVSYKIRIDDVEFPVDAGVANPDFSKPNPDQERNIILLPAVKIGTISSKSTDD